MQDGSKTSSFSEHFLRFRQPSPSSSELAAVPPSPFSGSALFGETARADPPSLSGLKRASGAAPELRNRLFPLCRALRHFFKGCFLDGRNRTLLTCFCWYDSPETILLVQAVPLPQCWWGSKSAVVVPPIGQTVQLDAALSLSTLPPATPDEEIRQTSRFLLKNCGDHHIVSRSAFPCKRMHFSCICDIKMT